jgi:hypothetical protein
MSRAETSPAWPASRNARGIGRRGRRQSKEPIRFAPATSDGKWSVIAFCNNVFNRVYFLDVEDFWSSPRSGSSTVIGQSARDAQRYGGVRTSVSF